MQLISTIILSTLLILATSCGKGHQGESSSTQATLGSVVGGQPVKEGQLQSVVALTKEGRMFCSGNLVDSKTIYTAGHCIQSHQFLDAESLKTYVTLIIQVVDKSLGMDKFQEMNSTEQLAYLHKVVKAHLQAQAKSIKFYFGNGKQGGEFEGRALEVESVQIDEEYSQHLVGIITGTKDPRDISKLATIHDQAVIKLKNAVTDITPVPLATDAEIKSMKSGDKVLLVGFGLKFDQNILINLKGHLDGLVKKAEGEKDQQVLQEIQEEYNQYLEMFKDAYSLYLESGDKNFVTTQVDFKTDTMITLKSLSDDTLAGSCSGDSGGPAFILNAQNQLRQVATVSSGKICGIDSSLAPVN